MASAFGAFHKTVMGKFLDRLIFSGRWLIAPMYFGLLVALVLYSYKFFIQLWELCHGVATITEEQLMLGVLSLVDISMVGNLIIMIIIGGYEIFVRKLHLGSHVDRPQWLAHMSSGTLKVKMGSSLIGVSSIHLLKDFINAHNVDLRSATVHIIIHLVFLISTICLVLADKWGHTHHSKQENEGHEKTTTILTPVPDSLFPHGNGLH
jgi:uncharacterized protein (TIGR00645 family)